MTVRINITCDNKRALARLDAMSARSKDVRPVLEYGRQRLRLANAENFGLGGLPSGGWEPRKDAKPWPLMVRTGKLLASLTSLFGAPNNIDRMSAEFGTRIEYAKFHQYGTSRMPARKVVFEPRGFASDLASKAARFIAHGVTP